MGFFISGLAAHMQHWTEEVRFGWLAVGSRKNSKNANKMKSEA